MGEMTVARGWNATIAVAVLVALLVQLWIAMRVSATPSAHAVGTLAGAPLANRILRVLSFFTVQSNILSGVTSAVAWVVYTLIHGASTSWYPYPFLDVSSHGYALVLANAVLVLVVLLVAIALFWLGDRCLGTRWQAHSKPTRRSSA